MEDLSALEPRKFGEHQSLAGVLSVLGLSRITEVTEWGALRSRILDSGGFELHVGGASSTWESLGMQRARTLAAELARLGVECQAFMQYGRPSVGCHRVAPTTAGTWRQIVAFTDDGGLLGRENAGRRASWMHDWPGNPWRHGPAHDAVEAVLLWHPSEASPDSFTPGRCLAIRTALSRIERPTGYDQELHAACNSVLYGSDAECARARACLANSALRVVELVGPARARAGREVA